MQENTPGTTANGMRGATTLALVAFVCVGVVVFAHARLADNIAASRRDAAEATLVGLVGEAPALGQRYFSADPTTMTPHEVRTETGRVLIVIPRITVNGYAGPISLLMAVDDERLMLTGVRVITHRETPGLGDRIDAHRSDWIRQFDGFALTQDRSSSMALLRLRDRNGAIDGLSGATITARAVVAGIREGVAHVFAAPSGPLGSDK